MTGLVFDIRRYSIHDGPGIRTVVFMKGCPLRCAWCHNPESQAAWPELLLWPRRCIGCGACLAACPYGAIVAGDQGFTTDPDLCQVCGACVDVCYAEARQLAGREMAAEEVLADIERDLPFYEQSGGGVTFSGGEPLAQPDFLEAVLRGCRTRQIHTAVDTCGFAPWEVIERLLGLVDLWLYDIKVVDAERHRRLTGVPNEQIVDNLRALVSRGQRVILRVPVVPGVNDDEDNVRHLVALAAGLPRVERLDLLPYHATAADKYRRLNRAYDLGETSAPSAETLAAIAADLSGRGLAVSIGG